MRARLLILALLLAVIPMVPFGASGQEGVSGPPVAIPGPDQAQILTTADGSTLIGRVVRLDEREIVFETESGSMTIPRERVRSIRTVPASAIRNGRYWHPDPNRTRLLFAPTGRMLEKGRGYFADYYVFFPTVNYGVTDRVSLGGGMSLFPTGNLGDQLYFFTPKVGLRQSERFNLAVGALVIRIPEFDEDEDSPLVSVIYSAGTWGGTDRNLTLGAGYGMVDTDFADRPLIVLGGEYRLTRRTALVSENWMMPGVDNILISYGLRLFTETLSVDLALLNTLGEDALFPGIPYVDFVWNF